MLISFFLKIFYEKEFQILKPAMTTQVLVTHMLNFNIVIRQFPSTLLIR